MSADFGASNSTQNKSPVAQSVATLATVWTPSTLVRALSAALAARFGSIALSGEISGLTRAASGHWYFTLKDAGAQVRCAMFRGRNAYVDFKPQDGMQVKVRAAVNVYEPRGELQILVESMQQAGQGALYERYLLLKATLQAEGLFAAERKRAVLAVPRTIGVVTSLQAAALRDVLTTLKRRAPYARVLIFPASVQGALAPEELLRALNAASASAADTLLLVRGGGSMEDLWAFNDAALARAIGQTRQPVISGVGHETDFTIADFVADLRAPTPTAAAELAATPLADLLDQFGGIARDMRSAIERQLLRGQQRLDRAEIALAQLARRSDAALGQLKQLNLRLSHALTERTARERSRLQSAAQRLERQRLPMRVLPEQRQRISTLAARLAQSAQTRLAKHHSALDGIDRTLQALSPQRTLERGYSAVFGADGRAITTAPALARQSRVRVRLADGELLLDVKAVGTSAPQAKPKPPDAAARQLNLE